MTHKITNLGEQTDSPETNGETPPNADVFVVGIGGSAGSLTALEAFLANVPDHLGSKTAFIIIQHLPKDYKSILDRLLQKCTTLGVSEIQDGTEVVPNHVYISPSNSGVIIRRGKLHLKEMSVQAARFPVDVFFRSLAEDQRERSVCIIFSGAGTDGTLGSRAIKSEGGIVLVQDPGTAQHAGMVESAIATGLVDHILPPEEIPAQLTAYVDHPLVRRLQEPRENSIGDLSKILDLIHTHTGHDFSGYKQTTLYRRIERRLMVNQVQTLEDYLLYLRVTPREIETLFQEFLVGVTCFFRDPEVFETLREKALPRIFDGKKWGDPVRIWVAGCSTGEEAYSLAILLNEYLDELKEPLRPQIFATDIDSRAIAQARKGIYPKSIMTDVSTERLNRFFLFSQDSSTYQIKQGIRDMIVFAEHNVLRDPPFSKLDLVSCRNLLMFLGADLQRKVLHLFSYALQPERFLLLGTSETIGDLGFYVPVERKVKLYRTEVTRKVHPRLPSYSSRPGLPKLVDIASATERIRRCVETAILERHTPSCVAVDRHGEIMYIHGRTGKYLEPAPGGNSANILRMAREGLGPTLAAAISQAASENKTVYSSNLKVKANGGNTIIDLIVSPLSTGSRMLHESLLVAFYERAISEEDESVRTQSLSKDALDSTVGERLSNLERELIEKEQYLQAVVEELESSNEELQSTVEEYHSAIEELETSKEEIQSVNEELLTVNSELQENVAQLSRANNDMNNMLAGTGIGIIFVDQQLIIRGFSPFATRVMNLIPSDVGRPVSHIASNLLEYDSLDTDVQHVLDTLIPEELEVTARNEEWYLLRILPYRTTENVIEGAVITFIDVKEQKRMQQSMYRLAAVVRDSNDAVTMQDLKGRILAWNPEAQRMYGWSEHEALSMNIRDMVPECKREEAVDTVMQLADGSKLEPFLTERLTREGQTVAVWATASPLVDKEGKPYAIATTERRARLEKSGEDNAKSQR